MPEQSSHGVSTTWPVPPHWAQPWVRTTWPKSELETVWTRPSPSHTEQVSGVVPAAAPLPPQVEQATTTGNGTFRATPSAASTRSISTSASTSAPRAARVRPAIPPKRSSPKNAEKMSARFPKSKSVGRNPPVRRPSWP